MTEEELIDAAGSELLYQARAEAHMWENAATAANDFCARESARADRYRAALEHARRLINEGADPELILEVLTEALRG